MKDISFGCKEHLDALCSPGVRKVLMDLETNWNALEDWERGEELILLVLHGCTPNALSKLLPCSVSTIKRCMDVADLKLFVLKGSAGFSAARFYRTWKGVKRAHETD